MCEILVTSGALVNATDSVRCLDFLCFTDFRIQFFFFNVRVFDLASRLQRSGETPLHVAAGSGFLELVFLFLRHGATSTADAVSSKSLFVCPVRQCDLRF